MNKKVAGYVRVSRVGAREGDSFQSPAMQADAIKRFTKARGERLVRIEEETDASGSRTNPKLRGLIDDVRAGRLDGIVVYRLDRFARSLVGGIAALEEIHEAGGYVATCEGGIDTSEAAGAMAELQLNLLLTLGQWERSIRAEGFESAKGRAVERGVHISGVPPVGFIRPGRGKKLVIDEATAPAVAEAFRLRSTGKSVTEIGDHLRKTIPNRAWSAQAVIRLLKNPVYTGQARQGVHVKENAHDRLIDDETFSTVQQLFKADIRTADQRSASSLLSGIIVCGGCGYAMSRNTTGDGLLTYRCRNGHRSCQETVAIMGPAVDEFVTNEAFEFLDQFKAEAVEDDDTADVLRGKLAKAKTKRSTFDDPDVLTALGKPAFLRGLAKVDKQIEKFEIELANLTQIDTTADLPTATTARRVWPTLSVAERREILTAMLEAVVVFRGEGRRSPVEDRVDLYWRGEVLPFDRPRRGRPRTNNDEVGTAVTTS